MNHGSYIKRLMQRMVGVLFPPCCLACEQVLTERESPVCVVCLATLPMAELEVPIKKVELLRKFYSSLPLVHAFALFYFTKQGKVQQLLHHIKYGHQKEIMQRLGRYLGVRLCEQGYGRSDFDLILPVPLHGRRLRVRGYNQSALFAQGLGEVLGIPVLTQGVIRQVYTATQTSKGRLERWDNVAEAFVVQDPCLVKGVNILLVDDLVTTGATLSGCGKRLLQAGAEKLSIATLAVAHHE